MMKLLRKLNLYNYIKKACNDKQAIVGFDFFIAFLFLLVYLSTSPYIYGWDDQHLEIPILKHLIDPSLYKGDYYVESAAKYFTCWLYPILAKLITVKQIPATYLFLFLISRYLMFYLLYRLWLWIGGSCFTAVSVMLMFLLLGRTDEFLYRSFCHEEFGFIFTFAGLYCFYRDWYLLAAFIFGLGVNIHAIYNLFPMLYMLTFLLFCHPHRFKMIFQTSFIFILTSLPFLCWQIPISISREIAQPVPPREWMPLYLLSCPQNFLFGDTPIKEVWNTIHTWWGSFAQYLFLIGLYVFQLVVNPLFRKDKKVQAIMGLSWVLIGVVYFFDYIDPKRFVLDLNLLRVVQFVHFFMMGYITIWACDQLRNSKPWIALATALLILACGTTNLIGLFILGLVVMTFIVDTMIQKPLKLETIIKKGIFLGAIGFFIYALGMELSTSSQVPVFWNRFDYVLAAMGVLFLILLFNNENLWLRRLLIIIPLSGSFIIGVVNINEYFDLKKNGAGPWELLRDWEDMQFFVRDHTPQNALFLTPYDMPMGGFRINSDRKPLVCYRDCGIIGFDYAAAVEWNKRIRDIKSFKVYTGNRIDDSVLVAILKYKVNYVIFMKYYGPPGDTPVLKKIYENSVFSLFQVL